MMVFEKSQPTTFRCSKCVIQCKNPAEMEVQDLSKLIHFLEETPRHAKPIPFLEAHSPTTESGATRVDNKTEIQGSLLQEQIPEPNSTSTASDDSSIMEHDSSPPNNSNLTFLIDNNEDKEQKMSTSSSALTSADTQRLPTGPGDSTNCSTSSQEDGSSRDLSQATKYVSPMKHRKADEADDKSSTSDPLSPCARMPFVDNISCSSQDNSNSGHTLGSTQCQTQATPMEESYPTTSCKGHSQAMSTSCASGTSTNTQTRAPSTSTVVQDGPDNNTSQEETVYGDYPMALVVLSGNHDDSRKDVEQCFPGKTIASVDDWKLLKKNWHLFTAILIDVGKPTTPDGTQKVEGAVSACLKNMCMLYSNVLKYKKIHNEPHLS